MKVIKLLIVLIIIGCSSNANIGSDDSVNTIESFDTIKVDNSIHLDTTIITTPDSVVQWEKDSLDAAAQGYFGC